MFLPPFLCSLGISLALTPLVIKWAKRYGFVDDPRRRHPAVLHKRVLPRAGGVPMFFAFLFCSLFFVPKIPYLWAIVAGSLINIVVGTLDDKYDLSPLLRLFTLTVSALPVILAGVKIYTTNPFGSGILYYDWWKFSLLGFDFSLPADLLLVFWIVWMSNMVNWTKGASQLPGISVIASLALAGVALKYQAGNPAQILTAQLCVILAGAVLGFLPFNFPPETMLPGFGASTFIGYNLAVLSVLSGGKLAAALLVLGVPTVDMGITLIRRIKSGNSIFYPDRGHFYHRLLEMGLTKRQVVILYWIFTLFLGILALNLESRGKFFAFTVVGVLVIATFFSITTFLSHRT